MDLSSLAENCLHCPNARCKTHCPCGNDIPEIIAAVKAGDNALAASRLYATNPFPYVTSTLCDHARQCRGSCIRGIRGEPIDFPAMENALSLAYPFPYKAGERNGKKVAIIGAGPSALSASVFLEEAGFDVDIYEKEGSIGGAILTGIPAFRFDKSILGRIHNDLAKLSVRFHFNHAVDKEELRKLSQEYDEVLIAIGAEKENRLSTPDCPDIYSALSLLHDLNIGQETHGLEKKEHIIVMGGGNVAMDVSRRLKRLGPKVTLIYRRDEASMPAQKAEIAEAKEDGVVFSPLTNVGDYLLDESNNLKGLELVSMGLGEKDESGRPSFFTLEGSEHEVSCDAFVMAIGEKSSLSSLVEESGLTGNISAIGDCAYGAKNIAAGIASGREKAREIIAKY